MHATWIATRTPPAPDPFRAHLMDGMSARTDLEARPRADALIEVGDAALGRVLTHECGTAPVSRENALDLLSADAFVTYAFEAAADEPATIASRADAAMRRVSARAVTILNAEPR